MRRQIMDKLRMAGDKLDAFDLKYSDAVKQRVHGGDQSGTRGLVGDILGARAGDVEIDEDVLKLAPLLAQLGARGTQYGIPAVGYAARYGAPAAGITLAGKGLMDIAGSFGGVADEPEPGTLPLY